MSVRATTTIAKYHCHKALLYCLTLKGGPMHAHMTFLLCVERQTFTSFAVMASLAWSIVVHSTRSINFGATVGRFIAALISCWLCATPLDWFQVPKFNHLDPGSSLVPRLSPCTNEKPRTSLIPNATPIGGLAVMWYFELVPSHGRRGPVYLVL